MRIVNATIVDIAAGQPIFPARITVGPGRIGAVQRQNGAEAAGTDEVIDATDPNTRTVATGGERT